MDVLGWRKPAAVPSASRVPAPALSIRRGSWAGRPQPQGIDAPARRRKRWLNGSV